MTTGCSETPRERLLHLMDSGQMVCDADDVAVVLGMSRWSVYDCAKNGTLPVEPIHVGRRLKWRVRDLAAQVGVA